MKALLSTVALSLALAGAVSAQTLVLGTGSFSGSQSQSQVGGAGFAFNGGLIANLGTQSSSITSAQASQGEATNAGIATPFVSANGSTSGTAEVGQTVATTTGGCVGLCANAGGAGFNILNGSAAAAQGFSGFGFTFP